MSCCTETRLHRYALFYWWNFFLHVNFHQQRRGHTFRKVSLTQRRPTRSAQRRPTPPLRTAMTHRRRMGLPLLTASRRVTLSLRMMVVIDRTFFACDLLVVVCSLDRRYRWEIALKLKSSEKICKTFYPATQRFLQKV